MVFPVGAVDGLYPVVNPEPGCRDPEGRNRGRSVGISDPELSQ
jgi:hypothetical protein